MLHWFFFPPHEQYSTTPLVWYFAILNFDDTTSKIFFFQYSISKRLQFISCSFIAQLFRIIYCKLVKYLNDNWVVDLHLETWWWSELQTSKKKACVLHFPNYQRLLVFFILSFFEKKFLILSMRKPRVINIILSSSVKFTVNQALWMWVYCSCPCARSALLSVAFLFRVRATVTLYQTQVSAFLTSLS